MSIISLVNQKGGVGKTTLSINIASYFAKKGHDTLIIDADPQGSVSQWQNIVNNKTIDVIHHPEATLHKHAGKLTKRYRYTIIDAPPALGDISQSAMLASNIVIVPVSPSALDLWSGNETVEMVKAARKYNKKLKAWLLVSKKIVGTKESHQIRGALKQYKTKVFETEISMRIDYARAITQGLSVLQYKPKSKAADEIRALCGEIAK